VLSENVSAEKEIMEGDKTLSADPQAFKTKTKKKKKKREAQPSDRACIHKRKPLVKTQPGSNTSQ
jgi:hypothetical protein